jgi:PrtD family type I secretion system ABC transporter
VKSGKYPVTQLISDEGFGRPLRTYAGIAGFFTCIANCLLLVLPLHMLQVYDRVLVSRSIETLAMITFIAAFLLVVYGFAELGRRRALSLGADQLKTGLSVRLFRSAMEGGDVQKQVREDMSNIRAIHGFLTNGQALAVLDAIFVPAFLVALFMVHPWMGIFGLFSAAVLLLAAILSEWRSRQIVARAEQAEQSAQIFAMDSARQNASVVGLGMVGAVESLFRQHQERASDLTSQSLASSGLFGSASRSIRNIFQILALSIGALLVLEQQTSAGAIVAGSIMLGKALAPIDQCIGGWRNLVRTREALHAISVRVASLSAVGGEYTPLPRPGGLLEIEGAEIAPMGASEPLFPKFNLRIDAGSVIAVIGRSGAGKTTLLNSLAGVIPLMSGKIRLGGRDVHAWPSDDRGRYVGYAPSTTELLPVSVVSNITRLRDVPVEAVYSTTSALGVHEMILSLSDGYDTVIGQGGKILSAGQGQGISLSRAFLGSPVLLLLDEPTAHLDGFQVQSLRKKITEVAKSGAIVFMAFQDMRLIDLASHVLSVARSNIEFLPRDQYLKQLRERSGTVFDIKTVKQ